MSFFITRKDLIDYSLYKNPKQERKELEKKIDVMLKWVAKRRSNNELPLFKREEVEPKQDSSLKWKGKEIDELKEREKTLTGS